MQVITNDLDSAIISTRRDLIRAGHALRSIERDPKSSLAAVNAARRTFHTLYGHIDELAASQTIQATFRAEAV